MDMTSEPTTPPRRPQHFNDNSFNDNSFNGSSFNDTLTEDAARQIAENEDRWVADFIARLAGTLEGIDRRK
jgi:hypothetical protein